MSIYKTAAIAMVPIQPPPTASTSNVLPGYSPLSLSLSVFPAALYSHWALLRNTETPTLGVEQLPQGSQDLDTFLHSNDFDPAAAWIPCLPRQT